MPSSTNPFMLVMQLSFYGGLLACMVGLPVSLWLYVRACRDLRICAQCLEAMALTKQVEKMQRDAAPRSMALSQFGR
jgi:hypothetical protein